MIREKKSEIEFKVRFVSGMLGTYCLHRGQLTPTDVGRGQLNTTHAKILLAIIHIWQKQNCRYADYKGYFSVVDISVRELAKLLGHREVSGAVYQRLLCRIRELTDFPIMLSNCNGLLPLL
jgi:hypothetical protein